MYGPFQDYGKTFGGKSPSKTKGEEENEKENEKEKKEEEEEDSKDGILPEAALQVKLEVGYRKKMFAAFYLMLPAHVLDQ